MKKVLLIAILIGLISISIIAGIKLNLFELTKPSAVITVVDLDNKPVPGATVTIDETNETWHWLGDVFNAVAMSSSGVAGFDNVIDTYDVNYTAGDFGYVDVAWCDMNGNGYVGGDDIVYVAKNVGLIRQNYPSKNQNVTDALGQVTFDIVYTARGYDYYTVKVEKTGYQTKITTIDLKTARTIVLEPLPTYTLTISSTTGGTTSPSPGAQSYTEGTVVSVSAIPNSGYKFLYWKLDGVINYDNPISVTMNTNHQLDAYFEVIPPPPPDEYSLTISCTTGGITSPSPGTYTYTSGTSVLIVATADEGYAFTKWVVDGQDYSTQSSINLVMTKSYNVKAVFTLIPKPVVSVLTLLKFPPNTPEPITLLAQGSDGKPLSGVSFTVNIMPKEEYSGTSVTTDVTKSDGTVTFNITTPPYSKYSPYNMTVYYQGKIVASCDFYVLPKIAIKQVSFSYEQVYTPGSYDFSYSGSLVDAEDMSTPLTDVSAYSKTLIDEKGTEIPVGYTSWSQQGNSFTFQARTFDYYGKYDSHTLTLTIYFSKSGYIDGVLKVTAKMVAPTVMSIIESSSVSVGTDTFTIAFKDRNGKEYPGLTEYNIEVSITDPDRNTKSTASTNPATQLQYTFNDAKKAITVAYTFSKVGTYTIVVKYSGLGFYQSPDTFYVTAYEAPSIPPILTNPYVYGFIGLIILIALLRRRKKQ